MDNQKKRGPLDGSTSGTIGGGGPETGGPTPRPVPPETPPVDPEDAASGRMAPDTLGATAEPDELGPGPSDVSSVRDATEYREEEEPGEEPGVLRRHEQTPKDRS